MKILLLGVFARGSTDNWKVSALRAAGHRVFPWPYRERPWGELATLGEPWDLVIVSKGVPLGADGWARLVSVARRVVLFWPDPFENWTEDLSGALRAHPSIQLAATSSVVLERIKSVTGVTGRRVLEGADTLGPAPRLWPGPIEPALLHFGHLSERRASIIDRLRTAGIPVTHLERPLFGADLQRAVLAHAAVLGVNTSPDLYSNRVQTVLAMGGVMLQEEAPGLDRDLAGVPGLAYATFVEPLVVEAARGVLKMERPAEVAVAAFHQRHSWARWAEHVLAFAAVGVAQMSQHVQASARGE